MVVLGGGRFVMNEVPLHTSASSWARWRAPGGNEGLSQLRCHLASGVLLSRALCHSLCFVVWAVTFFLWLVPPPNPFSTRWSAILS
jgi:hypothetical protein